MNSQETSTQPETPTDSPTPKADRKKTPNRGKRKRVLGQGEGDYCIYEIVPQGHKVLPGGSLLTIPNVPRFTSSAEAWKWVRSQSGDLLANKQFAIIKFMDIASATVSTKPTVQFDMKPKIVVTDPAKEHS